MLRWTIMTGKTRVLHVIKGLDCGGAERLVQAALRAGDDEHFEYEVAFARSDMAALAGDLRAEGFRVHDLGTRSDADLRWALRLRRLVRVGSYDVLHLHLPLTAAVARVTMRTLGTAERPRLVYTEHSLHPENRRITRGLRWATGLLDDVSIAVSSSNKAALPSPIRRRTRVVVHGVDRDELRAFPDVPDLRDQLGLPPGAFLIVTVANLTPQKGYDTLLRAVRQLLDDGHGVHLVAVGSGPLAPALEAISEELGLLDHVRFLGQRDDAVALMAAADVVVLPSNWECMPVAIMEALTIGAPIVATATGDVPWMIQDRHNGMLVQPRDAPALAEAIATLRTQPALRSDISRMARQSSAAFDSRRTASEIEQIYSSLVPR